MTAEVTPISPKVTLHTVVVTPETAARWLEANSINRKLRPAVVTKYAHSMAAGHWTVSNDDICFDVDGKLINGQHRLHAIIESGVTLTLTVKRNMPTTAMDHMDRGATRTFSDQLKRHGEVNSVLLASTLKQGLLIDTGLIYRDFKQQDVTDDEMLDYLGQNPQIRHSVNKTQGMTKRIDALPTSLSITHFLISRVNGSPLGDYYLDQLAGRAGEYQGSAVLAVDRRLREVRRNRQKYPVRNYIYLLLKGWNYYAAHRPVERLQMTPHVGSTFQLPAVAVWNQPTTPEGATP